MKKILIIVSLFYCGQAFGWGLNGHRVVGDIARQHLSKKAEKEIRKILGHESLAMSSNWMDEIRSDPEYDYTHDWHWVTIPDGMRYEETEKNPAGDLIQTIERLIKELQQGGLAREQEALKLKMLIHLVGDIHQPLHVGAGQDQGGNDIRVTWFKDYSNLHRVWDKGIIDHKKLSYTELSNSINFTTKAEVARWQHTTVRDWAHEVMLLRETVYNIPEDRKLGYQYVYYNYPVIEAQLLKAGVRLAGVLNEIYQ